jgi:hypothetical protein
VNQRIRVLQELGGEFERVVHHPPARGRVRLPRRRLVVVAMALLALLLAAVALAATGAFNTGTPVRPGAFDLTTPRSGPGAVLPRSVGGVAALADDPTGGPPWGLRVLRTTRGLGCVQIGRVVGGRLGVLGQDGAFANDGRFHPLPAAVSESPVDCGSLDARGRLYLAFASQGVPASAYAPGCTPPGDVEPHPNPPICPQADERAVYAGVLGPSALSVTYVTIGGGRVTAPVGPGGTYLIVLPADPVLDQGGSNLAGLLPSPGNGQPIRQIAYRGGLVCRIGALTEMTNKGLPCAPPGYERPVVALPPPRLVAAPIHVVRRVDVRVNGYRADDLDVSFVARVAVTGATSAYVLQLRLPPGGACHGSIGGTQTMADIAPGQVVHLHYAGAAYAGSPLRCRGHFSGTVYYVRATGLGGGPFLPPPGGGSRGVRVGGFAFTVG